MSTEDKENQSFEAHESTVKTPLKQTTTSNSFLAAIQPAASGHLTTPPKPNEVSPRDPWTPTANLKMLISAASPEIRNREQEKKLSDSRSESFEEHLSGDEYEKSQPSRKDKSLGLLCHKFLARYPCYPNPSKNNEICLDEIAEELNVERRRIYDIMNVLESLHMVSRLAKNKYSWHGCHNLKKTLQILKKVAEENKYIHQIELIKKRESEQESEVDGQKTELVAKQVRPNDHTDICFVELPGMEFRAASANSRKDKSLRVMSQKFVMLFLVSSPQVVSLEVAAKMLIGEDHMEYLDKSKFKTKIRRLYDIANVLSSLELIQKVHVTEEKGRKPAFKWTGPDIFTDIQGTQPVPTPAMIASSHPVKGKSSKENCSKNLFPARSKQGFTRHPSLIKTTKTTQSDWRRIRSAPSSPIKKNTSQIVSTFPSKMAQLAAICKQQLDEQSRDFKKMKVKLEHSSLPGPLGVVPPDSCLKPRPFLLPSQAEILPLIPSSISPAVLTPVHSNVSYAVYLQPSQTQIVTAYNPSLSVQPVPCTNVIGMKSSVKASSQLIPGKKFIEDSDSNLEAVGASAEDQNLGLAKEQKGIKDDLIYGKCFKRCKSVLEDSPVKKCKNEELELQDGLQGEPFSSRIIQSPVALHLDQENLTSSLVKKNKSKNAEQHVEYQCNQENQRHLLEYDKGTTTQEMPVAFAAPMHKTYLPSGYLIPLPQFTKLLSETTVSSNEKTESCVEQKTYSSPIADGIAVTSNSATVHFPAVHLTPLNLMAPSSLAVVPVVNDPAIASNHASPLQAPSSSLLNFMLQHVRLIPASVQVSAGSTLFCQQAEHVTAVPKSVSMKQGKALQNVLPKYSSELNGKSAPTTPLKLTTVSAAPSDSQKGNGSVFQMSGESTIIPGICSSSCESDEISQEELVIQQRELDMSTEEDNV